MAQHKPSDEELMDFAEKVLAVDDPYAFYHQNPEFVLSEFRAHEKGKP
jgi:hypothetical protein